MPVERSEERSRRTLLVTNDFPPRPGGIQSYLQNLVDLLPPDRVVVYAPRWRGDSHIRFDRKQLYEVVRHPTTLMLPTPPVARRAAELVRSHDCDAVWFGAAAPLAVMAPTLRKAGAHRILASTHGHEVGWSMLPAARQTLRHIGNHVDVVTYVSKYTRDRFASAFGAHSALEHLPPAVDSDRFRPDPEARTEMRARHGLTDEPTIVCVSRLVPRKGQDMLIRALPAIRQSVPGATLVLVGGGPYLKNLQSLTHSVGVTENVIFTGSVTGADLPRYHNIGDVFAMPARTRGRGLDVEGLGIVYLEASASGLPVVAGTSGGAPETVRNGETGVVVDGRSVPEIADAVIELLIDRTRAQTMGEAGRAWVGENWRWDLMAARLQQLIAGAS